MQRIIYGLLVFGVIFGSPALAREGIGEALAAEVAAEEGQRAAKEYQTFLEKMEEAGETFGPRPISDYKDHRTRVAFAVEGFRIFRTQLQELYLETRYQNYEAGLPILDEMETFLEELSTLAFSTLKPLSAVRMGQYLQPLRCWMGYMRQALTCEDHYFLTFALEHISQYSRAYRKAYCKRQCWEMTYWKRHFGYVSSSQEKLGEATM